MSRNHYVPPLAPKRCAICGHVLSERRPPALVRTSDGVFYGPYHMGCAERLRIEVDRGLLEGNPPGQVYGHDWTLPREETTPW